MLALPRPAIVGLIIASNLAFVAASKAGPPADKSFDPVPSPSRLTRRAVEVEVSKGLSSGTPRTLAISHIEVTQSIQDADHAVPILGGRRAYVRVFFDVANPSSNAINVPVAGALRVRLPDGSESVLRSVFDEYKPQVSAGQNKDVEAQRRDALSGLIFLLPSNLMASTGRFTVSLAEVFSPDQSVNYTCSNCREVARSFEVKDMAPLLRLTVVGVSYSYKGITYEPRPIDFDMVRSWLMRAYPISSITYRTAIKPYRGRGSHPVIDYENQKPDEFLCDDVNTFVAQLRRDDVRGGVDPRTHYFGLVYDGNKPADAVFPWMRGCSAVPRSPDPNALGSGPTGGVRKWGWDESGSYGGWYTAHELGHTLGRKHVGGTCREAAVDTHFPYAGGGLAKPTGPLFIGFDPGDGLRDAALPPIAIPGRGPVSNKIGHDVMSYCNWQWVSDYTSKQVYDRIVAENNLPGGPPEDSTPVAGAPSTRMARSRSATNDGSSSASSRLLHVIARLDDGWKKGSIVSVTEIDRAAPNSDPDGSSPLIETLGGDGRVIGSYPVAVLEFTDPNGDHTRVSDRPAGLISATVPTNAEVVGVRIIYDGKTVSERMAGSGRPEVRASPRPLVGALPKSSVTTRRAVEVQPPATTLALGERRVILNWEGSHEGGKTLNYSVQLSTDDGRSWETVAVDLTTPHVEIEPKNISEENRSRLSSGMPAKYKIIANDGFHTSELIGVLPQ
jgi:hypothetical protein